MYTKNYPRGVFHETAGNAIRISQPSLALKIFFVEELRSPIYPNLLEGYAGNKTVVLSEQGMES